MEKIAFLFPGQGSQKVGMGKDFCAEFDAAREVYQQADQLLDFSLSSLSFQGPEEKLGQTEYTQPAVLTASWAISRVLEEEYGLQPTHAAGHSLGEYTALLQAGSLDFPSALQLVQIRGRLMEEAYPAGQGTMAAIIALQREEVNRICEQLKEQGVVVPANFNCPGQVVISGSKEAVERAAELAEEEGARRVIFLKVSGPFHSPLMQEAADKYGQKIEATTFREPGIEVVANATGGLVSTVAEIKKALIQQLTATVKWEDSMRLLVNRGVDTLIEVGPGEVLKGLMRRIDRKPRILNVEDPASLQKTIEELDL